MEIGFVNFNQEALNRANKVMKLLQGQGAIDELGLGRIRDAFSNEMFPGLSVLQTHTKYFLLMPALYSFLEKTRLSNAREVRERIREYEIAITRRLIDGSPEGTVGIIGADSLNRTSDYVKYDPTYVYQAGMERYGLVNTGGNLYALMCERSASLQNSPKKQAGTADCGDDAEELAGSKQVFRTCGVDYNFRSKEPLDIALNRQEATFLKQQIIQRTKGSLLSYLLESGLYETVTENYVDFEALGELIKGHVPDNLWAMYSLALRFSRYAVLLRTRFAIIYDKSVDAEEGAHVEEEKFNSLLKQYRTEFTPYAIQEIVAFLHGLVSEHTCKEFCLKAANLIDAQRFDELDKLIIEREKTIKGVKRSKLANAKDYPIGKPFESPQHMSYRWNSIGFTVLNEIKEGLKHE
jgi:hypothetical protein